MIYVSTGGLKLRAIDAIKLLKKNKINNIELSGGIYETNLEKKLTKIKNIKTSFHNYFPVPKKSFVLNLGSTNKIILAQTIKHCRLAIRLSAKLGIKYYSLHAPFRISLKPEDLGKVKKRYKLEKKHRVEKIFKNSLDHLLEYSKKKGVKILIENNVISPDNYKKFKSNPFLLVSPKEISNFFTNYRNDVGLLFDVAHFKVSSKTMGFDLTKGYNKIYKFINAYHLSDNNGFQDNNLFFSKNSWFIKKIKKNCLFYTIEVYSKDFKRIKKLINLIKKHI